MLVKFLGNMTGNNKPICNTNCCVYGCKSVRKNDANLMFHLFPKRGDKVLIIDEFGQSSFIERRKLWEKKLKMGKKASNWMSVCSLHFKESDYEQSGWSSRKRLVSTAVPSRNLPQCKLDLSTKQKERSSRLRKKRQNSGKSTFQNITHESENIQEESADIVYGNLECSAAETLLSLHEPAWLFVSDLQLNDETEIVQNLSSYDPETEDPLDCRTISSNIVHGGNSKIPFEAETPVEESRHQMETNVLKPFIKPYFKSLKVCISDSELVNVCRICLHLLTPSQEAVKLNGTVKDSADVTDMLKLVLPDLDLALYSSIVICTECLDLIKYSCKLKETWLLAEKKLTKIIEDRSNILKSDVGLIITKDNYDLQLFNPLMDHDYIKIDDELQQFTEETATDLVVVNSDSYTFLKEQKGKQSQQHYCSKKRELKEMWGLGPYICERCGRLYSSKKGLRRHIRKHALLEEEKIKKPKERNCICEICGKLFTSPNNLARHSKCHENTKCGICNKEFNHYRKLNLHILGVHEGASYQCHLCGKKFAYQSSLRVHLKMHDPNKPVLTCSTCDKKFTHLYNYRKHLKRHLNQQSFICKYCGRCLRYKQSLEEHIRIYHTNGGKNVCHFCNKSFWKKCNLEKHKIRVHSSTEKSPSQQKALNNVNSTPKSNFKEKIIIKYNI